MLNVNTGQKGPSPEGGAAVWYDLVRPTDTERAEVERMTGLRVPVQAELSEIESSSRLSTENGVLYLSAPLHTLDASGEPQTSAMGFVLSDKHLLTVRFTEAKAIEGYTARFGQGSVAPCSVAAFLGLLEAIVDRLADVLEQIGVDLDMISRRIFGGKETTPAKTDAQLRATLRTVGRAGERLSGLRDSLLGIQRIVLFSGEAASEWIPKEQRPRLKTLRQDTVSLADYDVQLSNKVQFLLDATLGFISIEQNNGIKVLTVVSVVGVPPTLVASIYGMNFKWIPELQWEYGYFYGLVVIVLSAVVPLVWFKKRGWI